jgi:hypothetical protein
MEFKKGDKVQRGPFIGVVTGIGRKPGTIGMVYVKWTGYAGYVGGEKADPPCHTVVWAKDLHHVEDVPEKYR